MRPQTPNQALQQTAGHDSFLGVHSSACPAAAELGRSAAEGLRVGERYDLGWLVGRTLTGVEGSEHGSWQFGFGPDAELRAECPWRVVRDGGIALSSEDHGRQYGLPQPIDAEAECRALIGGAVVTAAAVHDETRDVVIRFASGTRLEVVPLSSGYESWQLGGPGGSFVVAQGGGQLAIWSAPDAEPGAAADGGA